MMDSGDKVVGVLPGQGFMAVQICHEKGGVATFASQIPAFVVIETSGPDRHVYCLPMIQEGDDYWVPSEDRSDPGALLGVYGPGDDPNAATKSYWQAMLESYAKHKGLVALVERGPLLPRNVR